MPEYCIFNFLPVKPFEQRLLYKSFLFFFYFFYFFIVLNDG